VDRVDRIYGDEYRRDQPKRGETIGTVGDYTTINSVHGIHSGSTKGIGRSGENEGSTKDPTTETGTTARRGSVGNWRVGNGAG
jgi:hypothetical protein